jgi:4-amino-4-deoxychorismate lyase
VESPFCRADTRLIETVGWDGSAFRRIGAHLARARASAMELGFVWDQAAIERALAGVADPGPLRVRLTIGRTGDVDLTTAPLPPNPAVWRLLPASERLDPDDPRLRHKTTERGPYDAARAALPEGVDEVLFLNTRGEVCEGTITTLFFDLGDGLMTPPRSSGCLPGILRAELLASGQAREAVLSEAQLSKARLWMGNSLRGLIAATL